MMLGLSLPQFTLLHVLISLVGIVTGFIVILFGFITGRRLPGWTVLFLTTTVLTSVTGFMFPPKPIGPPHIFGILSLAILTATLYALYGRRLAGKWRWIYVVGAMVAQYLNVFVAVVQAFNKIPALNALAPTQTNEPAFAAAQGVVLVLFVVLGFLSVKRFHPAPGVAFA
jgi:hypothetical protein